MTFNSTIKQKKCKCQVNCDKYPTLGYKGYFIHHFPGEIKKQVKLNKVKISQISRKLHSSKADIKSDYLKMADMLFGKWIKDRDSDSAGNINCVCCSQTFNLKDKDSSGANIVQNLHFVSRGTYNLRFSEINCHAGCSFCNLQMHLEPEGLAYRRFKQFLIDAVGEDEVANMEQQKRNINKLTESELMQIIEHYKPIKK
jgi:hypothetical protein